MDRQEQIHVDEKLCNKLKQAVADCNTYYNVLEQLSESYNNRQTREQTKMATYALNMTFQVIGEHVNNLSDEFKDVYLDGVDTAAFYKTRNIISHAYESVNMRVVKGLVNEFMPDIDWAINMFLADVTRGQEYVKRNVN